MKMLDVQFGVTASTVPNTTPKWHGYYMHWAMVLARSLGADKALALLDREAEALRNGVYNDSIKPRTAQARIKRLLWAASWLREELKCVRSTS